MCIVVTSNQTNSDAGHKVTERQLLISGQSTVPDMVTATMSASKMFDHLLNSVKSSNLNFHIQQTPFAVVIPFKKSPVRNPFEQLLKPATLESDVDESLKAEHYELCDRILKKRRQKLKTLNVKSRTVKPIT